MQAPGLLPSPSAGQVQDRVRARRYKRLSRGRVCCAHVSPDPHLPATGLSLAATAPRDSIIPRGLTISSRSRIPGRRPRGTRGWTAAALGVSHPRGPPAPLASRRTSSGSVWRHAPGAGSRCRPCRPLAGPPETPCRPARRPGTPGTTLAEPSGNPLSPRRGDSAALRPSGWARETSGLSVSQGGPTL